jgi:tetratricopeptide (TPR) repeat protein
MAKRFCLFLVAALSFASVDLASAQQQGRPLDEKGEWVHPPAEDVPPVARGERLRNLDFLFGALKVAPDDDSAKAVENRIWAVWLRSGGDTANLLMGRVRTAMESKDLDLALKLLDAIVDFKPDYVEGWDRRATLHYMKKEYGAALSDIAQVLAREPRHFGALFGLGLIMQEYGDDKRALEVYRKAQALHPHLNRLPELIKTLTEKVEGRAI